MLCMEMVDEIALNSLCCVVVSPVQMVISLADNFAVLPHIEFVV